MHLVFLADAPHIHARRWIEHAVANGDDCDVISFRPAEIEGARVHYIDGAESLGKARYLIHARRVRALIEELKPDLLHALHLTSYGFLGALSGVHPLIISVWGTDVLEAPRLTPFHAWLTRYALSHADILTATGLHLATETTRYAPQGKPVTVIPYGVDLEMFSPSPRAPGDTVVIGTSSRLSPEKGINYLVDAFARLHTRYGARVRLRIAGDTLPDLGGPDRTKLEKQARDLGIADSVDFLGWLEHGDLPAFLRGLDIFVMPSVYEGFGVSLVEASAAGLPVVASNVYGIPDVVSDGATGLLVPSKDPAALADAIATLIDSPGLRLHLGAEGRGFVSARYDWRQNTEQMDLLYASVLNQPAPAK